MEEEPKKGGHPERPEVVVKTPGHAQSVAEAQGRWEEGLQGAWKRPADLGLPCSH